MLEEAVVGSLQLVIRALSSAKPPTIEVWQRKLIGCENVGEEREM